MKYKYAPIREAVFDIRVDRLKNNSLEQIEIIHTALSDIYPGKKKNVKFVGRIELNEGKHTFDDTGSNVLGYTFSNSENTRQVQFRLDGFTFNMMAPYTDWLEFSKESFRLFNIYSSNLLPNKISRIALRYINRITLQMPFNDFEDYILNMPPIPKCLPQSFNNFFMQISVPSDKDNTDIIITETIESVDNNNLPFILDIDVFKSGDIKIDKDLLKIEFEDLRGIKNKVFESIITDKLRDSFNAI